MRDVRALPMNQLMLAASSSSAPVATPLWGGLPGKNERPHPSAARTSGTPSIIMSPDHRPWTQIRLGAGTPPLTPHRPRHIRRPHMS
jgi:hypothetical protein